jgi:predicted transcriptional regulator
MAGEITMSARELDRLEVIRRLVEDRLSQAKASELLGLTDHQVRRLCRALERSVVPPLLN